MCGCQAETKIQRLLTFLSALLDAAPIAGATMEAIASPVVILRSHTVWRHIIIHQGTRKVAVNGTRLTESW